MNLGKQNGIKLENRSTLLNWVHYIQVVIALSTLFGNYYGNISTKNNNGYNDIF